MKINYIVSNIKELWIPDCDSLFISDPYIHYLLTKESFDLKDKKIGVAGFLRDNREQMDEAVSFIQSKYEKYIPILAKRFNAIHGTLHSEEFWKKCFSMAFLRYLTLFHTIYSSAEYYFVHQKHICRVISEESYYTPLDFEDHRNVFQGTNFGQEQIFSIYMHLFYSENLNSIYLDSDKLIQNKLEEDSTSGSFKFLYKKIAKYLSGFLRKLFKIFYYALRFDFEIIIQHLKSRLKKYKNIRYGHNKVVVGIFGTHFSTEHLQSLINNSNEAIQTINVCECESQLSGPEIDLDNRIFLSTFEDDFDRFDRFIFSSFVYCFPRAFIENFTIIYESNIVKLKEWPNLKYIVNENWLSDTYSSIALAIMKENGVKHIYNEHNCIFHPFTGEMVRNEASMVDYYVSFGWDDSTIPNLIKGASLYPFIINKRFEKKYDILYVGYTAGPKMSHYGGNYGCSDGNALKFYGFVQAFMESLSKNTLKRIAYRGRPDEDIKALQYSKDYFLNNYLQYVNRIPASWKPGETCKEQMLQSHLVVVDYISTAYLESLHMNIPTVFFWDSEVNHLEERYSNFFQPLIDVGICQTDPVEAAEFMEKIIDNPEIWWQHERVQEKKDEWLNKNFQNSQVMVEYLLGLAK